MSYKQSVHLTYVTDLPSSTLASFEAALPAFQGGEEVQGLHLPNNAVVSSAMRKQIDTLATAIANELTGVFGSLVDFYETICGLNSLVLRQTSTITHGLNSHLQSIRASSLLRYPGRFDDNDGAFAAVLFTLREAGVDVSSVDEEVLRGMVSWVTSLAVRVDYALASVDDGTRDVKVMRSGAERGGGSSFSKEVNAIEVGIASLRIAREGVAVSTLAELMERLKGWKGDAALDGDVHQAVLQMGRYASA